jgi:hypothetical protein
MGRIVESFDEFSKHLSSPNHPYNVPRIECWYGLYTSNHIFDLIYVDGVWQFDVFFNELPTKIQSFLSGYEWGEDLIISSTIPITSVISEFEKEFGKKIEFTPNSEAKEIITKIENDFDDDRFGR